MIRVSPSLTLCAPIGLRTGGMFTPTTLISTSIKPERAGVPSSVARKPSVSKPSCPATGANIKVPVLSPLSVKLALAGKPVVVKKTECAVSWSVESAAKTVKIRVSFTSTA